MRLAYKLRVNAALAEIGADLSMFRNHFMFAFSVLIVGSVISTLIAVTSDSIDKGWWPVGLLLYVVISLIYAGVFSVLALRMNLSVFPAGYVHVLVVIISVILSVLFYYLPIDWLAINNGANMSKLQALVHSDITHYAVYLAGLIVALLVGFLHEDAERS